jgi:exopolysaccharide biosynthesis polyprenyl glycosylphosphotransferase
MSTRVHDGGVVSRRLPGVLASWSNVAAYAEDARWVSEAGRALLVWVPVYMLSADEYSSQWQAVAAASFVAVVWLAALRSAFGAVHFTLGPAIRAAFGTITGLVVVSAFALWMPGLQLPPSTLAAAAISVFVLTTIWEAVCQRVIAKRRVLIVGTQNVAAAVVDGLARAGRTPFIVLGMVDDAVSSNEVSGAPLLGPVAELSAVVESRRPDLIVLADVEGSPEALDRLLASPSRGFRVVGMAHFFEHAFGRVPLAQLGPGWFMSILHLRQRPYTRFAKRSFDVVGASVGLLVAAPLMLVIALLVRATGAPVIYRQTRVGAGGKHFTMYKFRTMRCDAEEAGRPIFAEERDPRVTRLGRVLRTTHLDELPQLWVVLKGDMSIVGPRPERPEFIPMLEEAVRFFNRRLLIKPGVTGWAQLRADYASDCDGAAEKLSYDLWYLRHRNLAVDLAICAKTFTSVLLRPGR